MKLPNVAVRTELTGMAFALHAEAGQAFYNDNGGQGSCRC